MPDKWEREIEDLLRDKFDDDRSTQIPPVNRPRSRPPRRAQGYDFWKRINTLSTEQMLVLGIVFAFAAYISRFLFGPVALLLALTSAALIFGAVLLSVLRHENPQVEKRWRGQVIKMPRQQRPTSFAWYRLRSQIRRWLTGRR